MVSALSQLFALKCLPHAQCNYVPAFNQYQLPSGVVVTIATVCCNYLILRFLIVCNFMLQTNHSSQKLIQIWGLSNTVKWWDSWFFVKDITKCPLTLILDKIVTVLQCMKNGTLCNSLWCLLWSTVNLIMSQYCMHMYDKSRYNIWPLPQSQNFQNDKIFHDYWLNWCCQCICTKLCLFNSMQHLSFYRCWLQRWWQWVFCSPWYSTWEPRSPLRNPACLWGNCWPWEQ